MLRLPSHDISVYTLRCAHFSLQISSIAGNTSLPLGPAYAASKGAVRSYGEALRAIVHRDGVLVNVVQPGWVKTPMTDIVKLPMYVVACS